LPKFITVDSAWHTYHVLLEDGVRQVELRDLREHGRTGYPLGGATFV